MSLVKQKNVEDGHVSYLEMLLRRRCTLLRWRRTGRGSVFVEGDASDGFRLQQFDNNLHIYCLCFCQGGGGEDSVIFAEENVVRLGVSSDWRWYHSVTNARDGGEWPLLQA